MQKSVWLFTEGKA